MGTPDDEIDPLLVKILAVAREQDLFRIIVRGFGLIEDLLEREIAKLLVEPLEGAPHAPFKHKLNLAVGLGIITPELRPKLMRVAKLRNALAHAERDPNDVTIDELQALREALDPGKKLDFILRPGTVMTPPILASLVMLAGYTTVDLGGRVAHAVREQEREALRRELSRTAASNALLHSLLGQLSATSSVPKEGTPLSP